MAVAGVVSEYNPFHSGHGRHLAALRQAFGPDTPVICAMSGNFVQRGEAALTDKWTRTRLALRQGADLILEIPTLWAISSAETFARGGVGVLAAAGVADTLSFGSEAGELGPLERAADCLASPAWREALRRELDKGLSFPAARQRAAEAVLGPEDFARLPDCGEGLCHRLYAAAQQAAGLPELYRLVQSKRYPLSRVRRLVLWAFLGLEAADLPQALPYLRVLGFTDRGRQLLREMKTRAALPVITKPAHIARLGPEARRVFALEARCTALYPLCRRDLAQGTGLNEYTQNPVVVRQ